MFLGYSVNSSSYRVFNQRIRFVGDNVNVVFDNSIGFYEARVTQTIDGVTPSSSRQAENKAENEVKEESEEDEEPEMT